MVQREAGRPLPNAMKTPRDKNRRPVKVLVTIFVTAIALVAISGCSGTRKRSIEVTAYCACSQCTDWERGSWKYLKLDFWNHYVSKGPRKGKLHTGQTASGAMPRQFHPGLFSWNTVTHPWKLPFRILFPWLWLAHDGTIAADTKYYAFGTRMYVPGYGYGVVEDRGGAIKGPKRLDLYYDSHNAARKWGRKTVDVEILN